MNTKVNMDMEIYLAITTGSEILKISRSELIRQVIKFFERDHRKNLRINRNVMYQKSYPDFDIPKDVDICSFVVEKKIFKQFHLSLNGIEYEIFTDMRKFCKMSVSLIIAESVRLYLDLLLNNEIDSLTVKNKMDNSPDILFHGRCFYWQPVNSGYKFTIEWGYPDKLPLDF